MTIYLSILLPTCLCDLPRTAAGSCFYGSAWSCSKWGLHNLQLPANYVSSYLTVSSLPNIFGGLFSVALSLKLPSPDVIRHFCPVELGLSSHL